MNNKNVIFWRVYLSFFALVLLSVGVVFNIVRIQTVEGAQWRNLADSLTTKYVDVKAKRGDIYAADGSLMATSLYRYDVHMDTRASGLLKEVFDEGVDSLAYQLSVLFKAQTGKSQADWKNTLVTGRVNGSRYLLISKDVSHTELKQLKQFHIFNRGQFRGGLIVEPRNERIHPYGNLAVRTLGYMRPNDTDYVVGLEGYFNKEIGGTAGKILKQKVSSKVWIPINNGNTLDPIDGYDLYTTLDVDIQDIVENALLKGLLKNKAHNGCAIVMDVKTGEIKAIANLRRSSADETKYLEIYNYAIGVKSTPGSTFKLASLLALLDNGYMLPTDTLGTEGGVWKIFEDEKVVMRDDHDYGTLTLQRAFEKSSNIFFGKAIMTHFGDKPQRFIDFLNDFGITRKIGLPIAGEPDPKILTPDSNQWSGTTLAWMAHGYEMELTPLQTLTLYNAVANKGTAMKPMLVREIRNRDKLVKNYRPEPLVENIVSPRTLKWTTEIMKGAVDSGTALLFVRSPKVKIAGKTGTAVLEKTEEGKKYQASFAGFFPADDPKYSCIVLVQDPQGELVYGAQVAGPVFKEIAEGIHSLDMDLEEIDYAAKRADYTNRPTFLKAKTSDYLPMYQSLGLATDKGQGTALWSEPMAGDGKIVVRAKTDEAHLIPDLKGLSLSDALYICENAGLRVKYEGSGTVYRQVPEKRTSYSPGKTIYINLR